MTTIQEVRTCVVTGEMLPIDQFYTSTVTRKDGTTYTFTDKTCKNARRFNMKKRRVTNKAIDSFNKMYHEEEKLVINKQYVGTWQIVKDMDDTILGTHTEPTRLDRIVSFFKGS